MLAALRARNSASKCYRRITSSSIHQPFRNTSKPVTSHQFRPSTSSSSSRWKTRQANDAFSRDARVAGLKSRAAFKLLQIHERHHIFKRGDTVVDLGFAPGSWSQVAANRTAPSGRVVGVDIIPAQPPRGVSTIQGDFLSPAIQAEVRAFVADRNRGRLKDRNFSLASEASAGLKEDQVSTSPKNDVDSSNLTSPPDLLSQVGDLQGFKKHGLAVEQAQDHVFHDKSTKGKLVDVVLSDMSEPWEQTAGFGKKSISDPYRRMMNTSGIPFRDHAGSMDLCTAALDFCIDNVRAGGHFVCKFYQGPEDKAFEMKLKKLFEKVYREKPEASRQESREGYFVGLRRREGLTKQAISTG